MSNTARRLVRALATLMALASLGAVTTVILSWACVKWTRSPDGPWHTSITDPWILIPREDWPASCGYQWRATRPGRVTTVQSNGKSVRDVRRRYHRILWVSDAGLPWPALRMWHGEIWDRLGPFDHPQITNSFDGGGIPVQCRGSELTLPRTPIRPGFLLDTLFYAAVAWSLWQIPLILLSRRRAAANHCPRCHYDLRGLAPADPCPECGATP